MTRREWLTGAGLAVASGCSPRKGSGFPGYALIADAGGPNLAVVDLTGFRLFKDIPLGAPASDVIAGRRGANFALTPETGSVHLIDASFQKVKSQRLAVRVSAFCLTPDGNSILAIAPESRELLVADTASLQIVARYKLSSEPSSVTAPPGPKTGEPAKPSYVAVSTGAHGSLELLDYGTGRRWQRELKGTISEVRFRADGERLLVGDKQERCISALSTPELEPIADLPLAMAPENLCFNADQGQLFVSGAGMDAVAIIFPYNPLEVDQTVLAGRDPGVMACSENPAYLFVGSNSGSDVCILNIDSRKMIGILDAGQRPTFITVTPDSQYALVLNEGAGTMAAIHVPNIATNAGDPAKWRNKVTAGLFTLLQVANRPVHAAIVRRGA